VGPRASLARCEKSRPHRDYFFVNHLLSFAQYTKLFVGAILDKAVLFINPGLVQRVRISCWRRCLAVRCRGWPVFWGTQCLWVAGLIW